LLSQTSRSEASELERFLVTDPATGLQVYDEEALEKYL